MTTLAQGASQTVAVRDGGTVTIATNGGFGSVVVTQTGSSAVTTSLGPGPERRVFGPYKEGASVVITNSSVDAFDYDAETTFDPSNVAITGGTIAGRYVGVSTLADALRARPNGVALRTSTLGNSIVAGVNGISFTDQALWQSASRLSWIYNGGIAGNTSAQMLARMATDVPAGAQVCLFMEGSNDSTGGSVAVHRANMEAIIQGLLARGILPVMVACPPYSTRATTMHGFLAAEHALARKYGLSILDPWTSLVDLTTGDWGSGNTSDSVHPTLAAGQTARQALADLISGTASTVWTPRTNISGTSGYCLAGGNCLMLTDTNADGVPDGWTKAGTATASVVAAPTGFSGNFAKLTGSSGGGSPYLRKIITTGWNAGDELLISFGMETGGYVANGSTFVNVICDGGATNINPINGTLFNVPAQRCTISITPTTTSQIEIYMKISGSVTGNYISFGEFEVYNLTALLGR